MSLPNNKKLTKLPDCVKDMTNLKLINFKGCDNLKIPEEIASKIKTWG
jgi:hypothetical protein